MSQYDQPILLAVLGAVAGMLVLVARQARERVERPGDAPPAPVVAAPALVAEKPTPESAPAVDPPAPPKRAKPKCEPIASPKPAPIDAVLTMLRDKDALIKAFLLREILDPPVSRRR